MKQIVTIRKAEKKDAEIIYQCNVEGLGYDFPFVDTVRRVHTILDEHCDGCFLVAEVDGKVAGYIHTSKYECTYMESYEDIKELALLPNYQGFGIGRLLLEAAEEWAKSKGAKGIRLISGMSRTGAHEFYLKCGYTHRKDHKNFIKNF